MQNSNRHGMNNKNATRVITLSDKVDKSSGQLYQNKRQKKEKKCFKSPSSLEVPGPKETGKS